MLKISCFEHKFMDALNVMRGYKKPIFLHLRLKSDFVPFEAHLGPILV